MSMFGEYKRLTKAEFAALNDEELHDAAILWTAEYTPYNGLEAFALLPEPCKNIIAVLMLNGEVENGGFNQFYFNGGLEYGIDYVQAFKDIDLPEVADLIQKANEVYNSLKDTLPQMGASIEDFSASYQNNPLNDLDDKYAEFFEDISQAFIRYIRNNIEYFGD